MKGDELPSMICNRLGDNREPLAVYNLDNEFLVGVYQGTLSPMDMRVMYRQRRVDKWSNLRTPKHIHWAVDVMAKRFADAPATEQLVKDMLALWGTTEALP